MRNIVFPTIIDAIAMDPGEHVLFAGGRDGNMYVAALNTASPSSSKYGLHILTRFSNHRYLSFLVVQLFHELVGILIVGSYLIPVSCL